MNNSFRVRLVNVRHRQHNQPWADDESSGLFHFRHDLLEQLPVYLSFVRKMEKTDPEAYAIYSKVGGLLLPPNAMLGATLADVDPKRIPAFVCAMLGSGVEEEKKESDRIWPRLLYLQKMNNMPGIQVSSGSIYSMTMFYTRSDEKHSTPVRYHVALSETGEVRLLRELHSSRKLMIAKHGDREHRRYEIPSRAWQLPRALNLIASESGRDVNELAKVTFCFLAGIAPRMQAGVQVRAHRGGPRAVFNITTGRTPYFFKDRDVMLNDRGSTKKIFHFVPGYTRSDGVFVRPHTKGLRDFVWNGFNIHIGMPGLDFPDINKFTSGAISIGEDEPTPAGMIDASAAVSKITQAVESSAWWVNRKRRRSRE